MKTLSEIKHAKATYLKNEKVLLIDEIKEAVHNLKLVRKGKLKARPAKELLDEL